MHTVGPTVARCRRRGTADIFWREHHDLKRCRCPLSLLLQHGPSKGRRLRSRRDMEWADANLRSRQEIRDTRAQRAITKVCRHFNFEHECEACETRRVREWALRHKVHLPRCRHRMPVLECHRCREKYVDAFLANEPQRLSGCQCERHRHSVVYVVVTLQVATRQATRCQRALGRGAP